MIPDERIHELSERRSALWAAGVPDPAELVRVTAELEAAYETKRLARAQGKGGTNRQIAKRARIELELEQLMTA